MVTVDTGRLTDALKGEGAWGGRDAKIQGHIRATSTREDTYKNFISRKPQKKRDELIAEFDNKLKELNEAKSGIKKIEKEISIERFNGFMFDEKKYVNLLNKKIEKPELNEREQFLLSIQSTLGQEHPQKIKRYFEDSTHVRCPFCLQPVTEQYKKNLFESIESVLSKAAEEQREEDIYKNQYCIIIDDPVSSFDMENRVGILSFLKHQLNKFISGNPKTKVVLLTHDLQTAYDIEKIYGEITDLCGISSRQADRNKYIKSQELINNAVREFNSSRRNEYTQLMINIYKYAKGENADYELVVGNSMRRVMEAYGSFMYKKGIEQLSTASEIKQKLEPPFGDHFENLMYRLVLHGGSHNEERVKSMVSDDFFDYISSEEKIRTAKEILVFLYTLDDQHVIEHLKRDLNGKTLNDVQTDLETWKQEILSLISLDE